MSGDKEKIHDLLLQVMDIERKYSFEKHGTETSKFDELMKLIDSLCDGDEEK